MMRFLGSAHFSLAHLWSHLVSIHAQPATQSACARHPVGRLIALVFLLAALGFIVGCDEPSSDHRDATIHQQKEQITQQDEQITRQNKQITHLNERITELERQLEDAINRTEEAHQTVHWSKNIIAVLVIFACFGFFFGISLGTMTKKAAGPLKTNNLSGGYNA